MKMEKQHDICTGRMVETKPSISKDVPKHIRKRLLRTKNKRKMQMGKPDQKVIVKDGKLIYYGHSSNQKRNQAYSFDFENLRFKQNRRNNGK